ncbi:hypothetical protein PVAP13_7NG045856 [Panicum virgatum]|uniref:Uncharacterized protein n=1 Tax=Panicum virgatum TaxID=38727 RepID=A0A8T0PVN8_PANVG|nr:hypothetical protein PVAP13_7NG045856 [Panicum virgatum]
MGCSISTPGSGGRRKAREARSSSRGRYGGGGPCGEILGFCNFISHSNEEQSSWAVAVQEYLLCKVEVFGSLRKWLCLSTSDIDVSIYISSSSLDF